MATIVFFSIPAQGHVHPTLGVVRELTARGHRVVYYSYEGFREKIRAAGGEFVGCESLDPTMGLTRQAGARVGSDLALSTRVLVDTLLALDEPVCRISFRSKAKWLGGRFPPSRECLGCV